MSLLEEKEYIEWQIFKLWQSYFKGKKNKRLEEDLKYNYISLTKINKTLYPKEYRHVK